MTMQSSLTATLRDSSGQEFMVPVEPIHFSPYRCFPMTGEDDELLVLRALVDQLMTVSGLALYRSGPFLDFMLDHYPDLAKRAVVMIDPKSKVESYRGVPVITSLEDLPFSVNAIFICDTRTETGMRLQHQIPPQIQMLVPHAAESLGAVLPARSWIRRENNIYPIKIDEVKVESGLDLLLLDMPARSGQQLSVSLSYVISALQRSTVKFQAIDLDPIWYHRYHIHRLYDLGGEPELSTGVALSADPWGWNERVWVDPRQWQALNEYFSEWYDELFDQILETKPKILAMSINARNEWITRHLAREVKKALPETIILVGGHSCYSDEFGKGAFPEYDYMVIGEADLVVGPLAEQLARGERPANTPGVLSIYDDPSKPFVPGAQPHNLDMLGGLAIDYFKDFNTVYQTYWGYQQSGVPLTRGCVWSRCTFCAERFSFRSRTPENYVDELERIVKSGRQGHFFASDSDYGGKPEVLYAVCEEVVRRGLKIALTGQIRLNKAYNVEFFKLMKRAGFSGLNFGADAFTENSIKRQAKGYTLDTLMRNHEDCYQAEIQPMINIVIGAPGETEQDMDETVQLFRENARIFPVVSNINICMIFQNSVFWYQPEKFDIHFYGDKDEIYRKYYFGIPDRLWYSLDPFIDRSVRTRRFFRLMENLTAAGIQVGGEVQGNLNDLIAGVGHAEYRDIMVTYEKYGVGKVDRSKFRPQPRVVRKPLVEDRIFHRNGDTVIAFPNDPQVRDLLEKLNVPHWVPPAPKLKSAKLPKMEEEACSTGSPTLSILK